VAKRWIPQGELPAERREYFAGHGTSLYKCKFMKGRYLRVGIQNGIFFDYFYKPVVGSFGMNPFLSSKPPIHLLSLEEAEERLEPYKPLLDECIQHGWDAWNRDYTHKHHLLRPRARAAIVFDEIVFKAQEIFPVIPGVKFEPHNSSFLLYIGDDIIIRFKKIKKNGRCSNINTRQQALFKLQQVFLPGMEPGTALTAGYALDELQRSIVRKLVVCQFDNRVLWTLELLKRPNAQVVEMSPTPPPTTPRKRFEPKPEAVPESRKHKKKGTEG